MQCWSWKVEDGKYYRLEAALWPVRGSNWQIRTKGQAKCHLQLWCVNGCKGQEVTKSCCFQKNEAFLFWRQGYKGLYNSECMHVSFMGHITVTYNLLSSTPIWPPILEMVLMVHYNQFQKMDIWIVNYFMRSSIDLFIFQTRQIPIPKLLVFDGHGSHLTMDAMTWE